MAPHERVTCYLYNQTGNTLTATGDIPHIAQGSQVFLLPNGTVLQAGGSTDESVDAVAFASVYEPSSAFWTSVSPMITARMWTNSACPGIVLDDGRVLFPGGR